MRGFQMKKYADKEQFVKDTGPVVKVGWLLDPSTGYTRLLEFPVLIIVCNLGGGRGVQTYA